MSSPSRPLPPRPGSAAPSPELSPPERIAASFKQLRVAAQTLSSASSELARPISILNIALGELNLGITAWERINGSDDDGYGNYWSHDVGYAKVGRKWGLALRTRSGNHNHEDVGELDEWPFDDAPGSLRIDAIKQLPALVDKLIKSTEKTARKMKEKAAEADLLIAALATAVGEMKQQEREELQKAKQSR